MQQFLSNESIMIGKVWYKRTNTDGLFSEQNRSELCFITPVQWHTPCKQDFVATKVALDIKTVQILGDKKAKSLEVYKQQI